MVKVPDRVLVVLAGIAAVEGLGLVGYAVFDIVEAFRVGITGPAEVSNPPALILLIVITALFGAGLLLVASGWWRAQRWARSPFVLAQIIIGLVGYEVAQSEGSVERTVGIALVIIAVLGLILSFAPATSRAIAEDE
jgi:hypothetical protein